MSYLLRWAKEQIKAAVEAVGSGVLDAVRKVKAKAKARGEGDGSAVALHVDACASRYAHSSFAIC